MHRGFVPLWRCVKDQAWYRDPPTFKLFTHLLIESVIAPFQIIYKGRVRILQPGQYWSTRERLAIETGLTQNQIRRAVRILQETQTITNESDRQGTVFTLVNREWWMDQTQRRTNEEPTKNQRTTRDVKALKGLKGLEVSGSADKAQQLEPEIDPNEPVGKIFNAYLESWKKNPRTYRLTPERKKWIEEALADKGVEMCLVGIDNFKNDGFERRAEFNGLEYLFGGPAEKRQARRDRYCRVIENQNGGAFKKSYELHRDNTETFEAAKQLFIQNQQNQGRLRAGNK